MHPLNNISIIGMGLIGGSIAKAWKKKRPLAQIGSLHADFADLRQACKERCIDLVFESWKDLMEWSDLIILATPLCTLSELALEISQYYPEGKQLLVIDVGSVKKAIVPTFERITKPPIEFLSTHPMAGKEKWGFANSDPYLFEHCPWIVTPHARNRDESLKKIARWIKVLGAEPIILSPEKHDSQTALISHLPALISRLLAQFVERQDPDALKIAGPGFHSMTRLSRDNPQLQSEIASLNREELGIHFAEWLKFIQEKK